MSDRTLRQRLVPEIGDEGQARIAMTRVEINRSSGLSGEIVARYLEHAGFAEVRARTHVSDGHRSALVQALLRDVLDGADPVVVSIAVGAAIAVDHIREGALACDRGAIGES